MAIHKYNEEYTKLLEHVYSLQPTDSATITLISSYIQGITYPYVRNKLRTHHNKIHNTQTHRQDTFAPIVDTLNTLMVQIKQLSSSTQNTQKPSSHNIA